MTHSNMLLSYRKAARRNDIGSISVGTEVLLRRCRADAGQTILVEMKRGRDRTVLTAS